MWSKAHLLGRRLGCANLGASSPLLADDWGDDAAQGLQRERCALKTTFDQRGGDAMDLRKLIRQILTGYKRLLISIAALAFTASIVWGIVSILLIASGKIPFSWWYLPFWIIVLTAIAGAVGSYEG